MKKIVMIVSVLFLLIGCGQLTAPIKTVNNFVEALKKHDTDKAYDLLSKNHPFYNRKDAFKNFVETRDVSKYDFKNVSIKNGIAEVKGYLIDGAEKINLTMTLEKENGKWKILNWHQTKGE